MPLPELQLRVRARGRHPWFYRKMVRRPEQRIPAGAAVRVRDRDDHFVGVGFYNTRCELALRMLTREPCDDVNALFAARLEAAIALREDVLQLPETTNAYRLVHAEGDGFPGLILDRLGDTVVAQVFSLGMQQHLEPIGEALLARNRKARLVLTVDGEAARREGMEKAPPPRAVETEVHEHGARFAVVPGLGHKTGFFSDQRDARQIVRRLAHGRRVLDLFCNAGGFAIAAARGGAREVVAADLDEAVIEQAQANLELNGLRAQCEHADAFDMLRDLAPGRFDLMVVDPPKWAVGKGQVEAAARRYRDINRLAFERMPADGLLLSCSCSGALHEHRFLDILREAATQAGRDVRVLRVAGAGPDHPFALECPEGRYLKVVLMQVR